MEINFKVKTIAMLAVGVVSLAFSYQCSKFETGSFERSAAYGGDAYTGIQNASAQTATNVRYLNDMVKDGLTYAFLIVGLGFIACAIPVTGTGSVAAEIRKLTEEEKAELDKELDSED